MTENNFSSILLSDAVAEFAKLPGIGKKTALRLTLHLLKQPEEITENFAGSLTAMRKDVKFCKICKNISDTETCNICSSPKRDHSTICVVENVKDVIALENTQQFFGVYHVLGGVISPLDGVGPNDLFITDLEKRIEQNKPKEIVFALNTTMEGETTGFYLFKKLHRFDIKITTIARGVAFGDELEYTDELTLGRSIKNRIAFEVGLKN